MLFDLQTIGDPDDGMVSAYTGCVDGNGDKVIATIDMKFSWQDNYMKTLDAQPQPVTCPYFIMLKTCVWRADVKCHARACVSMTDKQQAAR